LDPTPPAPWTEHADINGILGVLLDETRQILGDRLVGLYLYGSLVTGDFDRESSDIDLLAVTSSDIDRLEFARLDEMHQDVVNRYKQWENRLEIAYLSATALQTYRWRASDIAIISPGEPFHVKEAGKDWLINWYTVRERGIALFGPSPEALISPITREEFLQHVAAQTREWREWIERSEYGHTRPYQAYAILTMCRALYALRNGEQASKKQAALWAAQAFPEWSTLIDSALAWRSAWRDKDVDHEATFPETVRFVHFAIDQIA
jgi:predicted nucleotidyltransferase